MKLLHTADLHLDSPLRGLERYEGAPAEAMRGATRRALENLVALCLEEGVALVLIAGDLYDGDWRDYSTGLFFAAQMSRLREAGTRVVLVRGNHDAASQISRHLRLPENVSELSTQRPETRTFEDLGLAVHGQGFASRAVSEDLAAGYPEALPGLLNIALLHTALTGREGHEPYAPTSLEVLLSRGHDYWALGHVHQREVVHQDPWVVFPGNLQGRHAHETGPKGATLLRVEEGRIVTAEHRPLDAVRWSLARIDASEAASSDDVADLARQRLEELVEEAEGRLVAARVRVEGTTRAHSELQTAAERWVQELRVAATDLGGVWLERVRLATRGPMDREALSRRDDPVGQLVRSLREQRSDPEALESLARELDPLRRKLPPELREGPEPMRFDSSAVAEALDEVEQLLLTRLLGGEVEP